MSMLIAILFWFLCLSACAYALVLGGWEGRWTTLVVLLAALGTMAVNRWTSAHQYETFWASTNMMVLFIDAATFFAMFVIAGVSDRWWPIWVAAFQLNSVVAHFATMIDPAFSALVYQGYEGLWAIPLLLVMVLGIYRDRMWTARYGLA
ncbi:hypothetical protein [Sphingobium sp. SYK-6]|uniref:hypothetical protein n=1 Tax=Sphingobium sp. (strain NBRC 103272 / SYK-6) TaxID=627192 RepID=UPI0011D230EE|nr:hypothetical protein [Sphingobium sp. SYK-6]